MVKLTKKLALAVEAARPGIFELPDEERRAAEVELAAPIRSVVLMSGCHSPMLARRMGRGRQENSDL